MIPCPRCEVRDSYFICSYCCRNSTSLPWKVAQCALHAQETVFIPNASRRAPLILRTCISLPSFQSMCRKQNFSKRLTGLLGWWIKRSSNVILESPCIISDHTVRGCYEIGRTFDIISNSEGGQRVLSTSPAIYIQTEVSEGLLIIEISFFLIWLITQWLSPFV